MDKKRQTGDVMPGQGPLLSTEARLLEVILFLENEPVSLEKLMKMTSFTAETATAALAEIKEHYALFLHGLDLVESQGSHHFLPSSDLHDKLRSCYGKRVDRRLSRAALETLSIVCLQPTDHPQGDRQYPRCSQRHHHQVAQGAGVYQSGWPKRTFPAILVCRERQENSSSNST